MSISKYHICIIHQIDPIGKNVSGIGTFLRGFIKYAPKDFNIDLIGISSNNNKHSSNRWKRLRLGNKDFNFLPLLCVKSKSGKTLMPLSLRFTLALKFSDIDTNNKLLFFNRIEPVLIFRKVKTPKIAVVHNDIVEQMKKGKSEVLWSKFSWLYFILEKYIFSSLNIIYSVNKNTVEFYQSKYSKQKKKFLFLPTWVDRYMFYPKKKSRERIRHKLLVRDKHLPAKGKWILFVGRFQQQKAPIRLIQTYAQYKKRNKDSYLILIGEGNLKNQIKDYVRKSELERSVFFIDFKNQLELAEFYRASDVMLLTSNFEGMPMCVLEALGSGLPVVSTDVGEVKRVIKNGFSGEVVDSFAPEDIARALEKVIKNPNIYKKENCVSCISEYTPEKVLKPVYELMRSLIQTRRNNI